MKVKKFKNTDTISPIILKSIEIICEFLPLGICVQKGLIKEST